MPQTESAHAFQLAEDAVLARHGVTVTSRFLDLTAPAVRVRILESGEGPPVLLIPGDGAVAAAWAPLVAQLAGHRVIVVDRPGFGLSSPFDRSGGELRHQAVELLSSLLDALEPGPIPVIGSSGGAAWALWLGIDAPERVAAIVAMGIPGVCLPGVRPQPAMRVLSIPVFGQLLARIPAPSPKATGKMLAKTDARLLEHPEIVGLYHAAGRLPGYSASLAALFQAAMQPGGRPRAECVIGDEELQGVAAPTLFVFGADEPLGAPEVVRRAAALMPEAHVEIVPDAWHHPWLADAAGVGRLVTGFLTRGPARA